MEELISHCITITHHVYKNNTIVGAILIAGAYYLFTNQVTSIAQRLPSYSEATSELVSSQ